MDDVGAVAGFSEEVCQIRDKHRIPAKVKRGKKRRKEAETHEFAWQSNCNYPAISGDERLPTSIVICARSGPEPVLGALESLDRLPEREHLEIIVANCCGPRTNRAIAERYPPVKVVDLAAKTSIAESRNAAIEKTTGEIVAILHERYQVAPNWIQLIGQAHATHTAEVIAGCVGPPPAMTTPQWAMFLTEYSHIMPPLPSGLLVRQAACMIPGGNVSYKRSVFQRVPMSGFMWELDFHAALFDRGVRFYRDGRIIAAYAHLPKVGEYTTERREISRELACRRAAGMAPVLRLAVAASRMLLPAAVAARVCAAVWKRNGLHLSHFLQALPWMARFSIIQAGAEMSGWMSKQLPAAADGGRIAC